MSGTEGAIKNLNRKAKKLGLKVVPSEA